MVQVTVAVFLMRFSSWRSVLVVLPDICQRFIEEVLVFNLVLHVDHLAKRLLNLALTRLGEPPRVFRRLHYLRGWSHEEVEQVLA